MQPATGDLPALASQIAKQLELLRDSAEPDDSEAALAVVRAASTLADLSAAALRLTVELARRAGSTWQDVGDLLGVSRQAAFQRFGRPADPRSGEPMMDKAIPGAGPDAANLLAAWADGRYEEVSARFDDKVAAAMPASGLRGAWTQVAGLVGAYEGMGEPLVRQIGDHTVVDVPMRFEGGDMKGRIAFNQDRTIGGIFILTAEAP